ncbi:MAG: glycosyltransferase family 2 protein [Desulfurococcaceae archaeon]
MPHKPKVSIIILNYQGLSTLGSLLDDAILSALKQDYPNVEVLFVDNGSSDNSTNHVLSRYGDKVKVINLDKNYGFCLGNNLAAMYSSSDTKFLLFMNPDVILSRDYVLKLVDLLEENPSIAAIQGLEINPLTNKKRVGGFIDSRGYSVDVEAFTESCPHVVINVLIPFGAALLIRKDVFERVGGFSAEFFMYADEVDLGFRIWALGYKIVGSTISSYQHYISGIASKYPSLSWYFMTRNRLLLIIRYFYGKKLLKALIWNIILYIWNLTFKSIKQRFRVRLTLMIIKYIVKNLKRELRHRLKWKNLVKARWNLLRHFIVETRLVCKF